MRIAVIGAGLFGCHAASILQDDHEVTLFDRSGKLFSGASGGSQQRLHLGFHYPRSAATRREAIQGHQWFHETYREFLYYFPTNLYAVAKDSMLDFATYCEIMTAAGLRFTPTSIAPFGDVQGCVAVPEPRVDMPGLASHFERVLKCDRVTEEVIGAPPAFDLVIDCTYGQSDLSQPPGAFYRPAVMLTYRSALEMGLTVMDGPFFSLFPAGDGLHTLSHVTHSHLGRFCRWRDARVRLTQIDVAEFALLRRLFEADACRFIPTFREEFQPVGFVASVKTETSPRDRCCSVSRNGRLLSICPAKIGNLGLADAVIRDEVAKLA